MDEPTKPKPEFPPGRSRAEQRKPLIEPTIAKLHPDFARELLASVGNSLYEGRGLEPLQRDYLIAAIRAIITGTPAERALLLTKRRGRVSKVLSSRNTKIYRRVIELRDAGETAEDAMNKAGGEARPILSGKAVETICRQIKKATGLK